MDGITEKMERDSSLSTMCQEARARGSATGSSTLPFELAAGVSPISPLAINETQLHYWQLTRYAPSDLWRVAKAQDSTDMFMMVSFDGTGDLSVRLSGRTWERQEGHYPTIMDVFSALARHSILEGVRGDLMVWLEDGLWQRQQRSIRGVPVLAFGRHINDTKTLLMPDPAFLGSLGYARDLAELVALSDSCPWDQRKETVFFRGAASGLGFSAGAWKETQRGRLVVLSKELAQSELLDAKITRYSHLDDACKRELVEAHVVDAEVPIQDFVSYKYLVDADGYCCAWRSLFLKMAMGSLVLKIDSPYQQWYYHRLKPWKHYIPLAVDLSDFEAVCEWLREHDDDAREIALNGQQFVRSMLYSDALNEMAVYIKHLLACQRLE